MLEYFKIGLIVKPQGIRGELKVQPLTDDISRFSGLKEVIIEGKNYKISRSVLAGNAVILALDGVSDRNAAETFRGKFLLVKRDDAAPLESGRYFIADIIGCTVVTDGGEEIGKVTEVTSAKTDIFTLACKDGRIIRFPFLKDALVGVDTENGKITVKAKRFSEIACYEN